ncbi:folate-binding protein [Methylonatrum kenyense]|uniref:CAF17-like 4Fe-4S cluster assembly/insertion protein YgfZ n=1 Tax=Methylonatrum kenyense TaxID=455253 RepID=UPI0020BF43D2|nr:folate-binding protein [Methylonatrum kenyense]MCK8514758.1 folate-binding protein [Methylonatrum kenyense]
MSTTQNAATIEPRIVQQLEDGAVIPLPALGLLQVSGDDARAFLQAQLTQDISSASNSQWTLAGYCNPKGRLFGLFTVIQSDAGFLLLTRRSLLDGLLKRLRMFVLRSKVTIEDVSDDYACLGILGNGPLQRLEETAGSAPDGPYAMHQAGDLLVLNQPGGIPRQSLIGPAEQVEALQPGIRGNTEPAGEELWWLTEIRAGIPVVTEHTTEGFVPQQVNLELVGGVNFKKGCYPGQEIVARMHYLGKPSRRMYRMLVPLSSTLPQPGDKVTDGEGKTAGDVVIAAPGPDGAELLAVLKTGFEDRQDLQVGDAPAEIAALPYALEG